MSDELNPTRPQNARIDRDVEVRLRDADGQHRFVSTGSHTINVSEHGLLMEVPETADIAVGQEVLVCIRWAHGEFETSAEIVRFESPYWKDHWTSVMALRLRDALPSELLKHA